MVSSAVAVNQYAPLLNPAASPSAWAKATALRLRWDVIQRRVASEPTAVYVATDGTYIYVRFDAMQREAIAASAHSDDVGQGNDDAVWVDLWPNGAGGYSYQFEVTPNGTHYESSSENATYQPAWESHGEIHSGGYTATMKIPIKIMHGAHGGAWKAQFVRYIHATGEQQVWSYDAAQTSADDLSRAGTITLAAVPAIAHPAPRIALYGLATAASGTAGGSTSRSGADISVPLTATSSFYATFHPDFSNVELDQQTIAPAVTQRAFSEVRPFFTQGASFYNQLRYYVTASLIQPLYTPSIPTPREGYAVEGKQGVLSAAAFDAVGDRRTDLASVIDYSSPDTHWRGSLQRVAVAEPSVVDVVTDASVSYNDLVHVSYALSYGHDSGTNVANGRDAQWYDAGASWSSKTFAFYAATRKVGDYYNPVDGFVFHPGIAGWGIYTSKILDFSPNSKLLSAGASVVIDRYQGATQGSNQSDNQLTIDVLTKSGLDFQILSGSDYWRFGQVLSPISQSAGFSFTYHSGLQTNNPGPFPYHGSTATPTTITYNTGRYGDGRLDTWLRTSTIQAGSHGFVSVTLNDTAQRFRSGPANVQWFDGLAYTDQMNAGSSFSLGLRKVIGMPPVPNGGGNCTGTCTNVSLAYHYRMRHSELYLSYGDPNALTTTPQALAKWIFYAGADKGS
jgi:hypothetical protein